MIDDSENMTSNQESLGICPIYTGERLKWELSNKEDEKKVAWYDPNDWKISFYHMKETNG